MVIIFEIISIRNALNQGTAFFIIHGDQACQESLLQIPAESNGFWYFNAQKFEMTGGNLSIHNAFLSIVELGIALAGSSHFLQGADDLRLKVAMKNDIMAEYSGEPSKTGQIGNELADYIQEIYGTAGGAAKQ